MFFGIIIFVIGLAILFNALGILVGNFWGIFWGILFIVVGMKMIKKDGSCPMCNFGKMHGQEKCCGEKCCDSENDKCCGHEEK